jgi:hypothetical protein
VVDVAAQRLEEAGFRFAVDVLDVPKSGGPNGIPNRASCSGVIEEGSSTQSSIVRAYISSLDARVGPRAAAECTHDLQGAELRLRWRGGLDGTVRTATWSTWPAKSIWILIPAALRGPTLALAVGFLHRAPWQ